jgi:diguanylate cyclase (GGDEF)-like protein/PAS domain S-box-containing protein
MLRILAFWQGEYDVWLMVWAGLTCLVTSFASLALFQHARATADESRVAWIVTAGAVTATGILIAELIAAMAEGVGPAAAYHGGFTALSFMSTLGCSIAGFGIALEHRPTWRIPVGGLVLGAGIVSMDIIMSFALPASGHENLGWSTLVSAVPALSFTTAALILIARRSNGPALFLAVGLFSLGIVFHHLARVGSVENHANDLTTVGYFTLSHTSLIFSASGVALGLLFMCLVGIFADSSNQRKIQDKNRLLNDAVSYMSQGLCMFDAEGRLVLWNKKFSTMYALRDRLKLGFSLRDILQQRREAGTFSGDADDYNHRATTAAKSGETLRDVFKLADGRQIAVSNEPRPRGGWVSTHEDITELKQREASFRLLFENNPVPMWVYDPMSLRFLAVNNAAVEHYGYTSEQFLAMTILDIRPVDEQEALRRAVLDEDYRSERTWRHIRADGTVIEVAIFARALPYDGRAAGICAVIDLTDRKRAEDEVRRTRTFLDTIIENIPATILVKDARELRYVFVNRAAEELLGIPRADLVGKNAYDIFPKQDAETFTAQDRQALALVNRISLDGHPLHTPSNGTRVVTSKKLTIPGRDGTPEYLLAVVEDVTERRQAEERIAHMAHHDPLTNLPNRAAFNEFLQTRLSRAATARESFALLSIDLDRFKEVNDVFGHSTGDALLCEVADRLKTAGGEAFLSRLGGDEFIVVSPCGSQPEIAEVLAENLLQSVAGDIDVAGQPLRASVTIGVAIYPHDGADVETLLANGDAALYRAKAEARGSIRFFEPDMDQRLRERRALQHDLRSAIAREELELHYQPQASIDGEVTGFEALIRWHHPSGKLIPPNDFIPIAEDSGLIISLGEWVLRQACGEAAGWPKPLQIAINLSPVQFQHGDLAATVHSVLLETGLKASRLELEITEGVLIGDFSRAVSILRRLKTLGVRIAMDDFGTGYSSLSYLQSFPFDKIKIDRGFISNLEHNPQSAAIVRAVIGLGRGLHLPITAEGVETKGQLEFLRHESCQQIQGYLVGRPEPISHYAETVGRPAEQYVLAEKLRAVVG